MNGEEFTQVEDFIWCDHHTTIHEPDTDPYESEDVCTEDVWVTLWVKRKDLQ